MEVRAGSPGFKFSARVRQVTSVDWPTVNKGPVTARPLASVTETERQISLMGFPSKKIELTGVVVSGVIV